MNIPKIIAMYLPQYHEIPENNEWWGQGFTDWVNVKKAKPLYESHYQPRVPYENNYYNLMNSSTREFQAIIAKEYGIYGFCYYHYWFNGKQLLQKPINEVIRSGRPDFPFCLSWANEPWTRSWDGKTMDVIMPQSYGDKVDWKEHFNYLLTIFKDKRYILLNNKPLFLIYRTENIENCEEMLKYWNQLAVKHGFDGIYIVETLTSFQNKPVTSISNAVMEFEPMYTLKNDMLIKENIKRLLKKIGFSKSLDIVEYDKVWKRILERNSMISDKKTFAGAFVGWDNTPRKNKKGLIIEGGTPEKFEDFLCKQLIKSIDKYNSEFLFINAWNEWGEGAYLEPDEKFKFRYLEALRNAVTTVKELKLKNKF